METNSKLISFLAAVLAPTFALADPIPTATHDCVVIVLDDSGSMNEEFGGQRRMDAAKRGLKVVLRSVPKATWVGLLALNAGWAYPLGARDDAVLNVRIDDIETSGGTPLARNIKAGADRLMQEREKQFGYGSYRLLVVTDGQETSDPGLIEAYPPEVRSRGLTLDVIGVGIGEGHSLRQHRRSYRSADNPGELERAIREVFAERIDPSDQTGGEAFALIAGLDPGVAQAMITSLGKLPNHPIGEQPPAASSGGGGSSSPGAGGGGGGGYTPQPPNACGCTISARPTGLNPGTALQIIATLIALFALRMLYRTFVPARRRRSSH